MIGQAGRMASIHPEALAATLGRLESAHHETGVVPALQRVIDGVVNVFGVTGCGLMFVDDVQVLRYVVSSDEPGRVLELAQEKLGHGPCVDAVVHDQVVVVEDVGTDPRWPGLADIVVPVGVRSVLGIPVQLGGAPVGSLNVYGGAPQRWSADEAQALRAFTTLVEGLIGSALLSEQRGELAQQLQYALDNRVVIERAVGLLMGRDGLDAVAAFNHLRQQARSERRRVAEVATELLGETG